MTEEGLSRLVHLLRNISCGEMVAALKRDGFTLARKGHKGGHFYIHPDGRIVAIHYHRGSQAFTRKTLRSILEGTQWTIADRPFGTYSTGMRQRGWLLPGHFFPIRWCC